jgi:hypothetical protein
MGRGQLASRAVAGLCVTCLGAGTVVAGTGTAAFAAATNTAIFGMAATSARNAWAVGFRVSGGTRQTFIEHWNGRSWRRVRSPSPGGAGRDDELFGVTATSARSAWAVGFNFDGTLMHNLILRWNGRTWRRVPSPGPACMPGDRLTSVAAVSASDAWAAGTATDCVSLRGVAQILHWNGKAWKRVPARNRGGLAGSELNGITATGRKNAWAVGDYSNGTADQTLIEHWNGRTWKQVASRNPQGPSQPNVLTGVAASSASNAWAVGYAIRSSHASVTVIMHWAGKAWKPMPSPHPGKLSGDELLSVSAASARDVWAAGDYRDPVKPADKTLIVHWNGRSWRRVPSPTPAPPAHDAGLTAVAAISARSAWSGGAYASGPLTHPLIERWTGRAWRRVQG